MIKSKKGFTIIELLLVVAISLILAGAMYSFYTTVVTKNLTSSITAKKQQDVYIFLNQILKDLYSTGFGVDNTRLKMTDGNTCGLDSNNPFLTKCADGNNDKLYFISLASRSEANSGCWGYVQLDGSIKSGEFNIYSYLGRPCSPEAGNYLLLDASKTNNGTYDPNSLDPTKKNNFAIYIGNKTYPDDFVVNYYLDNSNLPSECAPGTYNLQRKVGGDVASPLVSCVLNFKIRYIDINNNVSTTIDDINKLTGIKLCMIVQIGARQNVWEQPPNYSSNGGCDSFAFNQNNTWGYYRWAVIEQIIPLMNIR